MTVSALPLYALLRAAGTNGVVVDLLRGCAEGRAELRAAGAFVVAAGPAGESREARFGAAALPFASRSVDAVVVPGSALAGDRAEGVLAEVRRVLAPSGFLAVLAASADACALPFADDEDEAVSVVELEGRLRRHFPHLTTLAQVRFGGFTLRRVGVREPREPRGGEAGPRGDGPPTHHVVLCSRRHRRWPDALTVASSPAASEAAVFDRVQALETALELARGELVRRGEALERLAEAGGRLRFELVDASARRDELEVLLREAERRAEGVDEALARAVRAEARAAALEARFGRMAGRVSEAQEALGLAEVRLAEAVGRAEAEGEAVRRRERELDELQGELEVLRRQSSDAVHRTDDLREEAAARAGEADSARQRAQEAEARAREAEEEAGRALRWATEAETRLAAAQAALETLASERRRWAANRAALEERLDEERLAREQAEVRAAEATAEGVAPARLADLEEQLERERTGRAEAEARAAELRASAEELADLEAALEEERGARVEAERAFEQLQSVADRAEDLEEALGEERSRREAAEAAAAALVGRAESVERELARLEGEGAGRAMRAAELEERCRGLEQRSEAPGPGGGEAEPRPAGLGEALDRERRGHAVELDGLRLQLEALLGESWELGERLERSARQVARLRRQLDEARAARQQEAAWALVMPEHSLPPELLPELVALLHRGRRLRLALVRLAAVAVAPPPEPPDGPEEAPGLG